MRACVNLLSYYVEDNRFSWQQPLIMVGLMSVFGGLNRFYGDVKLAEVSFVLGSMLLMFVALVVALVKMKVYLREGREEYGDLYTSIVFFFAFLTDLVYVYVESMKF